MVSHFIDAHSHWMLIEELVFLIYDCVTTMDREVTSFWNTKFNGAKALFLSNRYLVLLINVLGLIEFRQFTEQARCTLLPLKTSHC